MNGWLMHGVGPGRFGVAGVTATAGGRRHAGRLSMIHLPMIQDAGSRFLVARHDLRRVRIAPDSDAPAARALAEGQARLAVDHFALTANNITYAAFGDTMKYWQFFPTEEDAWGCVPVWGFATVTESRVPGVEPGQRCYGFLPMGTHLVVEPGRITPGGFSDGAAHRRELASIYNQYLWCASDALYDAALEGQQALLRPLFTTSFLIDDFLFEQGLFGARQIIMSSASSKTAYGTAFCLTRRVDAPALVGLTSPGNRAFSQSLGCYDEVLAYDDVAGLDSAIPAIFIDFAGDANLRRQVHEHLGTALKYSCSVGGTHWNALGGASGLPGPRPTLFFAPAQAKRRSAPPPDGWGAPVLQQRLAAAWRDFMRTVNDAEAPWLRVCYARGAAAVEAAFGRLLEGRADAREGLMLSMSSLKSGRD